MAKSKAEEYRDKAREDGTFAYRRVAKGHIHVLPAGPFAVPERSAQ
jgi:hypothetical protein